MKQSSWCAGWAIQERDSAIPCIEAVLSQSQFCHSLFSPKLLYQGLPCLANGSSVHSVPGIGCVFFFFPFIFISWRLITLQYCSGFGHTLTWISHGFTCIPHPNRPLPPPSPPAPSGSSQCTRPEHLSHASNLGCWSVSPLIIYMFRCCSPNTSHPCLLPQSPKVCSVHLCLFFCFAYRVIITIFLNSIYMH